MGTRLWLDLCRELLWKWCRYHLARGRNQFLIIESVKPCYLRLPGGSMFVWSPVLFGNVLKLEFQICKLRFRQESIPPPRVHNDTTSMLNNHFGARGFDINLTRSMFTYIYIMCVCPIKPYCIPSLNPIKWIKTQQSPTWTAPKNWFSTNKNEDDWSVADLYKFVADNNCDLVKGLMLLYGSKWDFKRIAWGGWQLTSGINVISVFSQREQFFALPTIGISKNLSWRVLFLHPGTVAGLVVSTEVARKWCSIAQKPESSLHLSLLPVSN